MIEHGTISMLNNSNVTGSEADPVGARRAIERDPLAGRRFAPDNRAAGDPHIWRPARGRRSPRWEDRLLRQLLVLFHPGLRILDRRRSSIGRG